jgi:hypothetical protein
MISFCKFYGACNSKFKEKCLLKRKLLLKPKCFVEKSFKQELHDYNIELLNKNRRG